MVQITFTFIRLHHIHSLPIENTTSKICWSRKFLTIQELTASGRRSSVYMWQVWFASLLCTEHGARTCTSDWDGDFWNRKCLSLIYLFSNIQWLIVVGCPYSGSDSWQYLCRDWRVWFGTVYRGRGGRTRRVGRGGTSTHSVFHPIPKGRQCRENYFGTPIVGWGVGLGE